MSSFSRASRRRRRYLSARIRREILRKALHILIAFTPFLASFNRELVLLLLCAGILIYLFAESLRLQGKTMPVVTWITTRAARRRDGAGIVMGPVTLAMGAMMSLILFPPKEAALGIYALAFGDGIASLAGTIFPAGRFPFLRGKTLSGSIACFAAVFFVSLSINKRLGESVFLGLIATVLEVLPLKDLDNILIPLGTGLAALLFSLTFAGVSP